MRPREKTGETRNSPRCCRTDGKAAVSKPKGGKETHRDYSRINPARLHEKRQGIREQYSQINPARVHRKCASKYFCRRNTRASIPHCWGHTLQGCNHARESRFRCYSVQSQQGCTENTRAVFSVGGIRDQVFPTAGATPCKGVTTQGSLGFDVTPHNPAQLGPVRWECVQDRETCKVVPRNFGFARP